MDALDRAEGDVAGRPKGWTVGGRTGTADPPASAGTRAEWTPRQSALRPITTSPPTPAIAATRYALRRRSCAKTWIACCPACRPLPPNSGQPPALTPQSWATHRLKHGLRNSNAIGCRSLKSDDRRARNRLSHHRLCHHVRGDRPAGSGAAVHRADPRHDPERRRAMALRACLIAGPADAVRAGGESILGFIGISMPAFRIAGGILLFLTALDMLFERRTQRREGQKSDPDHDPSVFPLAIPADRGAGGDCVDDPAGRSGGPGWGGTFAVLGLMAWGDRDLPVPAGLAAASSGAGPHGHHRDHAPSGHAAGGAVGAVRDRRGAGHGADRLTLPPPAPRPHIQPQKETLHGW
jgi:hypothetical protein